MGGPRKACAQERTRTSTPLRAPAPEAGASTIPPPGHERDELDVGALVNYVSCGRAHPSQGWRLSYTAGVGEGRAAGGRTAEEPAMADRLDDQGIATVFGGSGFVGRYAVAALAKQGWRCAPPYAGRTSPVLATCRLGRSGGSSAGQRALRAVGARALVGSKFVVNAVGVLTSGGRQTFGAIHVEGPRAIAKAAREPGVRHFVHVSAIGANANRRPGMPAPRPRARLQCCRNFPAPSSCARRSFSGPRTSSSIASPQLRAYRHFAAHRPRPDTLPTLVRRRPRRSYRRVRVRHR